MKVIPTAAGRRINTYQYNQNPVQIRPKQQFDSVSFGNTDRLVVEGDFVYPNDLRRTSIHIKGNARLGDAFADEDFVTEKLLIADNISAKTACLKGAATITDLTQVKDLVCVEHLTTGNLISEKAHFLKGATIDNNVKVETLTVANGGLRIQGNANIKRILSSGGNLELGDILELGNIVLSNPNPNAIPKPEKAPTRVLKFNSANVVPAKIRVVLDKFQTLVIHAPEAVLSRLEFCRFDDKIEGYVGEALPVKAMEKLVTFVKTAI